MSDRFTSAQLDAISIAYSAGNYAAAYESSDLETFYDDLDEYSAAERDAFILGFYSSCELHEISNREAFDQAYWSEAGQYVVNVACYCDNRAADYVAEGRTHERS